MAQTRDLGSLYYKCERCGKTIPKPVSKFAFIEYDKEKSELILNISNVMNKWGGFLHKCHTTDNIYGYCRLIAFEPNSEYIDITKFRQGDKFMKLKIKEDVIKDDN